MACSLMDTLQYKIREVGTNGVSSHLDDYIKYEVVNSLYNLFNSRRKKSTDKIKALEVIKYIAVFRSSGLKFVFANDRTIDRKIIELFVCGSDRLRHKAIGVVRQVIDSSNDMKSRFIKSGLVSAIIECSSMYSLSTSIQLALLIGSVIIDQPIHVSLSLQPVLCQMVERGEDDHLTVHSLSSISEMLSNEELNIEFKKSNQAIISKAVLHLKSQNAKLVLATLKFLHNLCYEDEEQIEAFMQESILMDIIALFTNRSPEITIETVSLITRIIAVNSASQLETLINCGVFDEMGSLLSSTNPELLEVAFDMIFMLFTYSEDKPWLEALKADFKINASHWISVWANQADTKDYAELLTTTIGL